MIYLHKLNSKRTISSLSDFIHNVFLYDGFFNVIGQFSNKKNLFLIANFGSTFFFFRYDNGLFSRTDSHEKSELFSGLKLFTNIMQTVIQFIETL